MYAMGWFIKSRNIVWELRNLWAAFLSFIFVFPLPVPFYPVALIYMGNRVKQRSWLVAGIISLIFSMFVFAGLLLNPFSNIWVWIVLAVLSPLIGNVYIMLIVDKYLKRLDLTLRYPLQWGEVIIFENKPDKENLSIANAQAFIRKLAYWKNEIDNYSIKTNIDKMIQSVTLIDQKDKTHSQIFLSRHAQTVDTILKQYDELENSRLENETMYESKKQLTEVIDLATQAFEKELTNQFKSEILSVTAETDAYLQNLKNRGLLESQE